MDIQVFWDVMMHCWVTTIAHDLCIAVDMGHFSLDHDPTTHIKLFFHKAIIIKVLD